MNLAALRDLLIRWANINSGSDHLVGLDLMRSALHAEFARLPHTLLESVSLSDTSALALRICQRPPAPIQILFSGYYGTVYGADHSFQVCMDMDANTLTGPGVADMKGGIVVMLAALQTLEASPHRSQLGWEVILSTDEEIGSTGSAELLAEAAKRHHFGLVFEPCRENGNLVKSRKGTGIFVFTVHGRSAHAGRDPEAGRNAILALSEFLLQADPAVHVLPGVMINMGRIEGGGAVNVVPDFAQAEANIRITRVADEALVLKKLREIAEPINQREGYRVEITGGFNRPPKETTPAEEKLFAAWQACGRELGVELDWQHVGVGSHAHLLS